MDVEVQNDEFCIKLDTIEASHLVSFLMHAKFSDDVSMDIAGSPSMRGLLESLLTAFQSTRDPKWSAPDSDAYLVDETDGGIQAPHSFEIIENQARAGEDVASLLFPFRWNKRHPRNRMIRTGAIVRMVEIQNENSKVGICLDCWSRLSSLQSTALVAWFDEEQMGDEPRGEPVLSEHDTSELMIVA